MIPPPRWVEKYLEIPYRRRGRDERGVDCFGMVRLVFGERTGVWLPSYDGINPKDRDAIRAAREEAAAMREVWRPVPLDELHALDILTMFRSDNEHVGIMVSPDYVLHTEFEDVGPCCVPLSDVSIRTRTVTAFRHRTLCSKN